MLKIISIIAFLPLAVVFNSYANDSDRIDRMEKEIQETKARLSKLEALLGDQSNSQNPVISGEAQAKMIEAYKQHIRYRITQFIVLPPNIQGNPEAEFDIGLLPTGNLIGVKIKRSSGNAMYDNAVKRAIERAQPLSLPPDAALFKYFREITLRFSAQE